jgi:type III restriction enzyme
VRGARVDGLFSQLQEESEPINTWESILDELEHLLRLGDEGEHTSETTPTLSRLGLPLADQRRIRGQLTPDGWLDLALTPLDDEPLFEYQTKEREFISFNSASAGQQATALLRILLAQTGMPLIIDQPEEDLDSQVIQDVVERIWHAKQGRQLIFASHNANLVVNGDAELVIACDYRKAGDQSGGRASRARGDHARNGGRRESVSLAQGEVRFLNEPWCLRCIWCTGLNRYPDPPRASRSSSTMVTPVVHSLFDAKVCFISGQRL